MLVSTKQLNLPSTSLLILLLQAVLLFASNSSNNSIVEASSTVGKVVQYGDLKLTYTTTFELIWSDSGSGGSSDIALYLPKCTTGFYPLGHMGVGTYDSPNGDQIALCVADASSTNTALSDPVSYGMVWGDYGSGANQDGSCWRPAPPQGYTCMGDVWVKGYNSPQTNTIKCVRSDLVAMGLFGDTPIWTDRKTGSRNDFSAWNIDINPYAATDGYGVFDATTFMGLANSYNKPDGSNVDYTLRLPIPTVNGTSSLVAPKLTSTTQPPTTTEKVLDKQITVPFTWVQDGTKSTRNKVDETPFYTLTQELYYTLEGFVDNTNGSSEYCVSKKRTVGISQTEEESWSEQTGISVGVTAGVQSLSTTIQLSYSFGYTSTSSYTEFQESELTYKICAPAGMVGAVWVKSSMLTLRDGLGNIVGTPLSFVNNVDSFVIGQYGGSSTTVASTSAVNTNNEDEVVAASPSATVTVESNEMTRKKKKNLRGRQ